MYFRVYKNQSYLLSFFGFLSATFVDELEEIVYIYVIFERRSKLSDNLNFK